LTANYNDVHFGTEAGTTRFVVKMPFKFVNYQKIIKTTVPRKNVVSFIHTHNIAPAKIKSTETLCFGMKLYTRKEVVNFIQLSMLHFTKHMSSL